MSLINDTKMDKTVLTVASLHDPSDENQHWRRQTPEARWEALEFMRQVVYGYDPSTERLQRSLTVIRIKPG